MTGNASPEDGGTDWRRLAGERNVPLSVARALWERACAAAPGDPVQAEHAFLLLLEEAEAANITQEPGRGTLADSSAREGFSLGPGKWTRVLLEQGKSARPAPRPPETGKRPTADQLRNEILAAEKAAKDAAALLVASDPATIIQVLSEVSRGESSPVLQKVVGMAGSLVGRILSARAQASPGQASPTAESTSTDGAPTVEGVASAGGNTVEGVASAGSATVDGVASARGNTVEEVASAGGLTADGASTDAATTDGAAAETIGAGDPAPHGSPGTGPGSSEA